MNDDKRIAYMVAIYGALQKVLKGQDLVDDNGKPLRVKNKHMTELKQDSLKLYEWFADALKDVSEYKLNKEVNVFNDIAKSLHDNYWLNMYLLALFMAELFFEEHASPFDKNKMMPKINRMIKGVSLGISDVNDDTIKGQQIIKDSKVAASNIYRKFTDQAELTKEVRNARLNQWKEASRNKRKNTIS